jgi:hypothetical protein
MIIDNQQTSQQLRSDSTSSSVRGITTRYRQLKPFSSDEMRVLLLENVSPVAVKLFKDAGYQVPSSSTLIPTFYF